MLAYEVEELAAPSLNGERFGDERVAVPLVHVSPSNHDREVAFVRNGRLDILAINALGRALWAPAFDEERRPVNLARFNFLDPRARDFYQKVFGWEFEPWGPPNFYLIKTADAPPGGSGVSLV